MSNYDPAHPVEFTATSDFDDIAEVINVSSIGADGSVTIRVEGKLPGKTTLTLAIPSIGVSIQVPVSVDTEEPVTYLLTVASGIGGGEFEAGAVVTIVANAAPSGKVFDKWTATAGTLANATSATTTFTMPASAATVTATYKDAPVNTYALMYRIM